MRGPGNQPNTFATLFVVVLRQLPRQQLLSVQTDKKVEKSKVVAKQDIKEQAILKFTKREVPEKKVLRMEMPPKLKINEKVSKRKVPKKPQDKLDKMVVKTTWNTSAIA